MGINVEDVRQHFPALEEMLFFNTAGVGITPQPVTDELVQVLSQWTTRGAVNPEFSQEMAERAEGTRQRAARFFGVDADELVFTDRVGESLHIVTDGLAWRPGDEILTSDEEVLYLPLFGLAAERGVVVKKMRFPHDKAELLTRVEDLITPRTRLIWFSDTTNKSGIHIPAKEICHLAHQKDVLVFFDGAQTAGQFPVDIRELGCDFYAITGYKWMLGPYGMGLFYIKKELIPQVKAARLGTARTDYENKNYREADTALRYEFNARSKPLRIGFGKTVEFIDSLGIENIARRALELAQYLKRELSSVPGARITSPMEPSFSSGIVSVAFEGMEPRPLVEKLWKEAKVAIFPTGYPPTRPDLKGLRFSLDFYNTREEVDRLIDALKRILA